MSNDSNTAIKNFTEREYQYGFETLVEMENVPKGLNEDTIRFISAKKREPEWMLNWRLKAFRHWLTMVEPTWSNVTYPRIDFQEAYYYAAPKNKDDAPKSLDEVDPELRATFDKLGIPLDEQKILSGVAVDAIIDSVSVKTTFRETLAERGIIFCSISEAIQKSPNLILSQSLTPNPKSHIANPKYPIPNPHSPLHHQHVPHLGVGAGDDAGGDFDHIAAVPVDLAEAPGFHLRVQGHHLVLFVYVDHVDGDGHEQAVDAVARLDQQSVAPGQILHPDQAPETLPKRIGHLACVHQRGPPGVVLDV